MNKLGLLLLIAPCWAQATTIDFNVSLERLDDRNGQLSAPQSLLVSVEGTINSFTVLPFWSDLANPGADFLPFDLGYQTAIGQYRNALLPGPDSLTVSLNSEASYSRLNLSVTSNFGEFWHFIDYTLAHPEARMLYGFTLRAVDYTPFPVAETGSSFLLLALGLLGLTSAHHCLRLHHDRERVRQTFGGQRMDGAPHVSGREDSRGA